MNKDNKNMFKDQNIDMTKIINEKILRRMEKRSEGIFDLITAKRIENFKPIQQDIKQEILKENEMFIDNMDDYNEFEQKFSTISESIFETYIKFFENNTISPDDLVNLYYLNSYKYSTISFCPICRNIVLFKDNKVVCMNSCYNFSNEFMEGYSLDNILELVLRKYKEHINCNAGIIKIDLVDEKSFIFLCGNCLL